MFFYVGGMHNRAFFLSAYKYFKKKQHGMKAHVFLLLNTDLKINIEYFSGNAFTYTQT